MENTNQETPMTTEQKYGAKPTTARLTEKGNTAYDVDVIGLHLSTGKPLEDIISSQQFDDGIIFNDPQYYNAKFSSEFNPTVKNAPTTAQIQKSIDRAKVLYAIDNDIKKQGYSLGDVKAYQQSKDITSNGSGIIPTSKPILGTRQQQTQSYQGFVDASTGSASTLGTQEEMAEHNPRVLMIDANNNKSYDVLPATQEERHEKWGKGKNVVTTTIDDDGQPILTVMPADAFVRNDEIYSSRYGARNLYGNGIDDFFGGFWSGAWASTIQSTGVFKAIRNDAVRYDSTYLFSKGNDAIYEHYKMLTDALKLNGTARDLEIVQKAYESGDYNKMNEAFNYAYNQLPSKIGKEISYNAQPLDYQKVDREIQSFNNKWAATSYNISNNFANGKGALNFAVRNSTTLGYLLPQVLMGVATQGATAGATGLLGATKLGLETAKILAYAGQYMTYTIGTAQSVQDFYRTGVEAGVDPELMSRMGILAIPVMGFTEKLTSGWMFKNMDNPAAASVTRIYRNMFSEVAKKTSKEVSDVEARGIVNKAYRSIFKDGAVQQWLSGGSVFAPVISANVSEVTQENLEEFFYNGLQMYIDKQGPEYKEGKYYGTQSLLDNMGDTTAGTIFATTILSFITGMAPRMYRKARGIPTNTKTDQDLMNYQKYKVIHGEGKQLIADAHEQFLKDQGRVSLSDAIIGEAPDLTQFVVPKSPSLQALGYEAGSPVTDLAFMNFVNYVEQIDGYVELNSKMAISEIDRNILAGLGNDEIGNFFDNDISLKASLDAFEKMLDTKNAIAELESTIDENGNEVANPEVEPLMKEYEAAKAIYEKYSTIETETKIVNGEEVVESTGHSFAVNEMMKRNTALVKQVEAIMDKIPGMANLTAKQKVSKEFRTKYAEAWKTTLAKHFTYDSLNNLRKNIEILEQQNDEFKKSELNRINTGQDYSNLVKEHEKLLKQMEDINSGKITGEGIDAALGSFGDFSSSLAQELTAAHDGFLTNAQLTDMSDKYKGIYESAKNAVDILRGNAVETLTKDRIALKNENRTTEKTTLSNTIAQLEQSKTAIQNDIDQLSQQTVTPDITKAIDDKTQELLIVEQQIADASNQTTTVDTRYDQEIQDINDNGIDSMDDEMLAVENEHDNMLDTILETKKAMGVPTGLVNGLPALMKVEPNTKPVGYQYRNETDEEYEKRKEKYLNTLNKTQKNYLDGFFNEWMDDLKEAKAWIDSKTKGNKDYEKEYPKGQFSGPNGANLIRGLLDDIKKQSWIGKGFAVAQAINGDERFNKHSLQKEKDFVALLAENGELNDLNVLFNQIQSLASEIGPKVGEAEFAAKAIREHNKMLLHESAIQSVQEIASVGLTNADGTPMSNEWLEAATKLEQVGVEVIDAQGQYNEEQVILLAKREEIMNNALSFLQNNQEVIFSGDNLSRIFKIFEDFKSIKGNDNDLGTIFHSDEGKSHIGEPDQTIRTREDFITAPLKAKDGTYYFDPKLGRPNYMAKTRLKEHFNVLLWIGGRYSINDIVNERKKNLEKKELDIETGEQSFNINSIIAFTTRQGTPIAELLFNHLNTDGIYDEDPKVDKPFIIPTRLHNSLTVGGDYGTGKTQFVVKRALDMIYRIENGFEDANKTIKSLVFANITPKLEALHKETFSLQSPSAKYISLVNGFLNKLDTIDTTEDVLYIIDEASIISEAEYQAISNKFAGQRSKILFLGDMFQMRATDSQYSVPPVMFRGMTTHLMTEQFSSNSELLRQLAEETRPSIVGLNKPITFTTKVSEVYVGEKKKGARYFANQVDVVSAFITGIEKNPNRAIVFPNKALYDQFVKNNPQFKDILETHNDKVYFAFRKVNGDTENLLQGLREEEVYMAYDQYDKAVTKLASTSLIASSYYTSIGRAGGITAWFGMIGDTSLNTTPDQTVGLGQETDPNSPLIKEIKERFWANENIRYQNIDSEGFTTDGASNVIVIATNPVNIKQPAVKFTYKGTPIKVNVEKGSTSIEYGGKSYPMIVDDSLFEQAPELIKDVIEQEARLWLDDNYVQPTQTQKNAIVKEPVESFTNNGNIIQEGETVIIANNNGTVQSIQELTGPKGTSHEVSIITDENVLKTLVVNPTDNIVIPEELENEESNELALEDGVFELQRTTTRSLTRFKETTKKNRLWMSSATMVGITSVDATEIRERRAFNDTIIANQKQFATVGNFQMSIRDTTGLDGNNKIENYKDMLVITFVANDIDGFHKLLAKHSSDTAMGDAWRTITADTTSFDVGSLTQPKKPIIKKTTINGKDSFYIEYINTTATTAQELAKEWDNILTSAKSIGTTQKDIQSLRDLNVAVFNTREHARRGTQSILARGDNHRRIKYSKQTRQAAKELFVEFPNAKFGKGVSMDKDHRMRLTVQLTQDESIQLVVTLPKFNEGKGKEAWVKVKEAIKDDFTKMEKALASTTKLTITDKAGKNKIMRDAFAQTTLFQLLSSNRSNIINNKIKGIADINSFIEWGTDRHLDVLGADESVMMKNYGDLSKHIYGLSNEEANNLYDFLIRQNDKYVTHTGDPIIDVLYTHGVQVMNTASYFDIDKPPSKAPAGTTSTSKPPVNNAAKNNRRSKPEHLQSSTQDTQSIEQGLAEIESMLGSQQELADNFMLHHGFMYDDQGNRVNGMLQDNSLIKIAVINGRVGRTTIKHEVFHMVYGNFILPAAKLKLNLAARIIALSEGKNIDGNVEEWMAYDFGNGQRTIAKSMRVDLKEAITLWDKFKAFMRGIIKLVNPIYYANKALLNQYDKILNGEYKNRMHEVKVEKGDIMYEHGDTNNFDTYAENNSGVNDESYIGTKSAIMEASEVESTLINEVLLTEESMKIHKLNMTYDIVQNSNLSNVQNTESLSLSESIDKIINNYALDALELGEQEVSVFVGGKIQSMAIKDVYDQGLGSQIEVLKGVEDSMEQRKDFDFYVLNQPENSRHLIQLLIPTFNMANNEWGKDSGPDDRFDWSSMTSEDLLSKDKKLVLEQIPLINAQGNMHFDEYRPSYLPYNQVTARMKQIGSMVNTVMARNVEAGDTTNNRVRVFMRIMESLLSASKVENGYYVDSTAEMDHSIYAALFGGFSHPDVVNYQLDYSDISTAAEGTAFVGMVERAEYIHEQTIASLEYNENGDAIITPDVQANIAKARQINDFIRSMIGIYSSLYTKEQLKSTYYNGTMKTTHLYKDTWRSDSLIIENAQMQLIREGELDAKASLFIKENIAFEDNTEQGLGQTISVRLDFTNDELSPVFYQENSRFNLFDDNGDIRYHSKDSSGITEDNIENFEKVIKFIKAVRGRIGLGIMKESTIDTILKAKSFDDVTEAIKTINDMGYISNFMDELNKNYDTPADFLIDYVATMLHMQNQYNKTYDVAKVLGEDEDGDFETSIVPGNITRKVKTDESLGRTNSERVASIEGSGIIIGFIERTTPYAVRLTYEVNDDSAIDSNDASEIDVNVEIEGLDAVKPENFRYLNPQDLWVANNLLGSMIQRLEGKYDDRQRRTAEGTLSYPIAQRSALQDQIDLHRGDMNAQVDGYGNFTIETTIESLGIGRSLGFTTIGRNRIDAVDFMDSSINMFMQEMRKTLASPSIVVPIFPASDTGKITYARAKSAFINTKNGFSINYDIAAQEIMREYSKFKNVVRKSKAKHTDMLTQMKSHPTLQKYAWAFNELNADLLYKDYEAMSMQANKDGRMQELKAFIDGSNLIKDPKVIKGKTNKVTGEVTYEPYSNFDIGYKELANGDIIVVPGRNTLGKTKGFDIYNRASKKGLKYITSLEKAIKAKDIDGMQDAITMMFQADFKEFADMIDDRGYDAVGSMYALNNRVTPTEQLRNKKDYYQRGPKGRLKLNQPMLAFYLSTIFANNRLEDVTVDAFSFNGFLDKIKRFGPANTPGLASIINERRADGTHAGTLLGTSKTINTWDIKVNTGNTAKTTDKGVVWDSVGNEVEIENGQIDVSPLWYQFFERSFGGLDGTVLGKSNMLKPLANFKRDDGSYVQYKSAFHVVTSFDMQSDGYRNLFNRMLAESDRVLSAITDQQTSFLTDMFKETYDESTDKNFDEIMRAMHTKIVMLQYNQDGSVSQEGIKLYEAVVNSIIAFKAPVSTNKGAVRQVNTYDPAFDSEYGELALDEMSNSDLKAIMNPSQPSDLSKLQAQPTQLESQLGVSSSELLREKAESYRNNRTQLQVMLMDKLNKEISNEPGLDGVELDRSNSFGSINWSKVDLKSTDTRPTEIDNALAQLFNFLRKKNIVDLRVTGQDLAYIDLFSSKEVSMQLPVMRAKLVSSYLNLVNTTLQGRTTGIRLTQTSGHYIQFYEKDGMVMTKNDVVNQLYGDWTTLSYDEYSALTSEVLASKGYTVKSLDDMTPGEQGTKEGQVVMPNIYKKIYGHLDHESYHDIMTVNVGNERVSNMDTADLKKRLDTLAKSSLNNAQENFDTWEAIINSPMVRKALMNLGVIEKFDQILTASDQLNEHKNMSANLLKQTMEKTLAMTEDEYEQHTQKGENLEYNAQTLEQYKKLLSEDTDINDLDATEKVILSLIINADVRSAVLKETRLLAQSFNESMSMLLSRVPLTFIGSGGVFKTVMFHNTGNVVYIPLGMTTRNDSDFDIDALTAYANSLNSRGHKFLNGVDGVRNELNKLRNEMYLHKSNQTQLFIKSSTKNIKDIGEQNRSTKDMNNNSPLSIFEAYDRNKAGADGIGILANSLNAVSMILTMASRGVVVSNDNSIIKKIIDRNINKQSKNALIGDTGVIYNLGAWEQTVLDNAKNNDLGAYGIPAVAINLLAVLKMENYSNQEVFDFFNNHEIKKLLTTYSKKTRILETSSNYDLYSLAKNEFGKMVNKIEAAKKGAVNTLELAKQNNIELVLDTQNQTKLEIELASMRNMIEFKMNKELIAFLKPKYNIAKAGLPEAPYFAKGSNDTDELNRWKDDHKVSNDKLSDNRNWSSIFEQKTIEDSEEVVNEYFNALDSVIPSTAPEYKNIIASMRAIAEMSRLNETVTAMKYMRKLPAYSIAADTMYRLSSIMSLRNGTKVMDGDFMRSKNNLELFLGMTLDEYVKKGTNFSTLEKHLIFYMQNDEYFLRETDDKKRATMIAKETAIFEELNIAAFVRQVPQLDDIIRQVHRQDVIKASSFISDSFAIQSVIKEYLALQNRAHLNFDNELAVVQNAVFDVVLDNYYLSNIGNTNFRLDSNLDLKDISDRELFITGFPTWMMDVKNNMMNEDYLLNTLPIEIAYGNMSSEEIMSDRNKVKNLKDNIFMQNLVIDSLQSNVLKLSVNTKEMVGIRLSKFRDAFNELPKYCQDMFINYEIINNKMNYRPGGIMHVIGVNFYKGDISKIYEKVHADIKNNVLDGLVADAYKHNHTFENDIKNKLFDYMGLHEELAKYVKIDEMRNDGPTYIYNYGEAIQTVNGPVYGRKRMFFKKNEAGGYEPIYQTSRKSSTSLLKDMTSNVKTFRLSNDEAIALQAHGSAIHRNNIMNAKIGDFLKTSTGELVRVTSANVSSFTYRSTTQADQIQSDNAVKEMSKRLSNRVFLQPGTLAYSLFAPDATKINPESDIDQPIVVDALSKLLDIVVNGKTIFNAGDKFSSLEDALNTYRQRVLYTIPGKEAFYKDGSLDAHTTVEGKRKHLDNIYRNILTQTQYNDESLAKMKITREQFKAAYVRAIEGVVPVTLELMKMRLAQYVGNSSDNMLEVLGVLPMINGKMAQVDSKLENRHMGKTTYAELMREAVKEINGEGNPAVLERNEQMFNTINSEDLANQLFDTNFDDYKNESKKNIKEADATVVMNSKELNDAIDIQNKEVALSQDEFEYVKDGLFLERFGATTRAILNDYWNFKKGDDVYTQIEIKREKLISEALDIGTDVDGYARNYFSYRNSNLKGKLSDPTYTPRAISLAVNESKYNKKSLLAVFEKMANDIEAYALKNGFTVEYNTKEIAVYDQSNPTRLNNAIYHNDAQGNHMQLSGTATKTDLVVIFKKEINGQAFSKLYVLDFKTTWSNDLANPGVIKDKMKWAVQTVGTAAMFSNNFDTPVAGTGIIPIAKVVTKGKPIQFVQPKNMDHGKNALPWHVTTLSGKLKEFTFQYIEPGLPVKGLSLNNNDDTNDLTEQKLC